MTYTTIFFLAIALSMDAFAVSISNMLYFKKLSSWHIIISCFVFGLFQALMPLGGFLTGKLFYNLISAYDHWIALILLGTIGGKMVFEAIKKLKKKNTEEELFCQLFTWKILFIQAIATSIDAFAVGLSFSTIQQSIFIPIIIIAIVTFCSCLLGHLIGKKFGSILGKSAEIIGGLLLIAIGIKIFIEC